jgi:acyl-CoA thioester hydrolase
MDGWYETEVRVRYAETDQMGIVHHANYLVWFEAGRSELCRQKGFSYKEMEEEDDSLLVVAETYCRYKSPAYYEDVITIRTKVGEMRSRSLRFIYEVYRVGDETLIAEGETLHVVTDKNKKVKSLPQIYKNRLTEPPGELSFPPDRAPS